MPGLEVTGQSEKIWGGARAPEQWFLAHGSEVTAARAAHRIQESSFSNTSLRAMASLSGGRETERSCSLANGFGSRLAR